MAWVRCGLATRLTMTQVRRNVLSNALRVHWIRSNLQQWIEIGVRILRLIQTRRAEMTMREWRRRLVDVHIARVRHVRVHRQMLSRPLPRSGTRSASPPVTAFGIPMRLIKILGLAMALVFVAVAAAGIWPTQRALGRPGWRWWVYCLLFCESAHDIFVVGTLDRLQLRKGGDCIRIDLKFEIGIIDRLAIAELRCQLTGPLHACVGNVDQLITGVTRPNFVLDNLEEFDHVSRIQKIDEATSFIVGALAPAA